MTGFNRSWFCIPYIRLDLVSRRENSGPKTPAYRRPLQLHKVRDSNLMQMLQTPLHRVLQTRSIGVPVTLAFGICNEVAHLQMPAYSRWGEKCKSLGKIF